jgi:hypothetical protein
MSIQTGSFHLMLFCANIFRHPSSLDEINDRIQIDLAVHDDFESSIDIDQNILGGLSSAISNEWAGWEARSHGSIDGVDDAGVQVSATQAGILFVCRVCHVCMRRPIASQLNAERIYWRFWVRRVVEEG